MLSCDTCGSMLPLNKAETRTKILKYIEQNPDVSINSIAKEFILDWTTVNYHVNILIESKMIEKSQLITFGLGVVGRVDRTVLRLRSRIRCQL